MMPQNINSPVQLYVSDPHGEYEELSYILRGACGRVRAAIDAVFADELSEAERAQLATLVIYPREKLAVMDGASTAADAAGAAPVPAAAGGAAGEAADAAPATAAAATARIATYPVLIERLARLARWYQAPEAAIEGALASALPAEQVNQLSKIIREAAVNHVFIVGDIYDRGPAPDLVMEELLTLPHLDILWGNHDILWMGAALGQPASVATAVRICARYGNLSVLEENYGIDLSALRTFALETYKDDPCDVFYVKHNPDLSDEDRIAHTKVQKAIAMIQFKIEAALIDEYPSFGLESRNLLRRIDFQAGTVEVDGVVLPMLDMNFPTVNPADPCRLTPEEAALADELVQAFTSCEKLQRHVQEFMQRGSLYKVCGDTLLFHACVPLNADGSLMQTELYGETLCGKALFDAVDGYVRDAYTQDDPAAKKRGLDTLWYLWLGVGSPLFAKSKMATFELYFVEDKAARTEAKNAFYALIEDASAMGTIFKDFGVDSSRGRIICGHVPVKVKNGEDPVKCGGHVVIIDGGMSIPYQSSSGVAGFTIVEDASGMHLATHKRFCGIEEAVQTDTPLFSEWRDI